MFAGHYGVSFAAKATTTAVPLWVWFIAVQWLDVVWSILVLLGIERVRIVPGFTEANALDLYCMPLDACVTWDVVLHLGRWPLVALLLPGKRPWVFCFVSGAGFLALDPRPGGAHAGPAAL